MREDGALDPRRELIRIVECERGTVEVSIEIAPRFDYGAVRPWLRRTSAEVFTAIGGDDGLLVWSDGDAPREQHSLIAHERLPAGEPVAAADPIRPPTSPRTRARTRRCRPDRRPP